MPNQQPRNPNNMIVPGVPLVPEENPLPVPQQPRQPTNLQGLLRFATEVTRNEDAPSTSNPAPMDDERRKFLEEAISNLTVDVTAEMQTCISILGDQELISSIHCDSEVPDNVLQAFDSLLDIVENLDMSIGFYKLDGYKIIPVCLSCEHVDVRSQACQLLAEISQNNTFCQSRALESGFISIILNILKGEENTKVLRYALYAVSCLVREHEPCAKAFLSEGGCDTLIRCINRPSMALRNKASFIISHIYPRYPEMKDKTSEILEALATALKEVVDDNPGHILNALRIVVTGNMDSEVITQCSKPELALKQTIDRHLEFCGNDFNTYMEEIDYCNDILNVLSLSDKSGLNTSDEKGIER